VLDGETLVWPGVEDSRLWEPVVCQLRHSNHGEIPFLAASAECPAPALGDLGSKGSAFAAIAETTSFLHYFSNLPDYRQAGKVDYPFPEVLLLILLAVLAEAEAFMDIARFCEKKLDLLRRFLPFMNGTPAHDHLGDIFATLDARAFQGCFVVWVAARTNTPAEIINFDGKT
jgi:DDE_Tnp_1-associated